MKRECIKTGVEDWLEYRHQVVQGVIREKVHSLDDVFSYFDEDGEPEVDDEGNVSIPMKMQGSGYRFVVNFNMKESESEKVNKIILAIDNSYREVLDV